jgi:hypothetical protein
MRQLSIARLILALLCSAAVVGCEGDSELEPWPTAVADSPAAAKLEVGYASSIHNGNPFLGSWRLAKAVVGDQVFDERTLLFIATYRSDGTHSVSVVNDVQGLICGGQTSCEWEGTYTYTATTITHVELDHPDPDEAGEDTAFYAFCGGKWFLLDSAGEEGGVKLTFVRARRDCYVRDCD